MSRWSFIAHSLAMLVMGAVILLNVAMRSWVVVLVGIAWVGALIAMNPPRRA